MRTRDIYTVITADALLSVIEQYKQSIKISEVLKVVGNFIIRVYMKNVPKLNG
jgi:hypothetical protein